MTISQSQINFKSWTGFGYIIIDPNNGSGAYLISGGANGGFLIGVLTGFGLGALVGGIAFGAAPILLLVLAIVWIASTIAASVALSSASNKTRMCAGAGFKSGLILYGGTTALLSYYGLFGGIPESSSALAAMLSATFGGTVGLVILSENKFWECL